MCDEKPKHNASSKIDRTLAQFRADWNSLARYRVFRSQYVMGKGSVEKQLLSGLDYDSAKREQARIQAAIEAEPGYRRGMGAPSCSIELEDQKKTFAAYQRLSAEREANATGST